MKKVEKAKTLREAKKWSFRNTFDAWCGKHVLPMPAYEHRFHPERMWRFDVAWPDRQVALEIHGGLFTFGHHSRGKGFLDDREKIGTAVALGWKVLEVAPSGKHPNTLYSPAMLAWCKAVL